MADEIVSTVDPGDPRPGLLERGRWRLSASARRDLAGAYDDMLTALRRLTPAVADCFPDMARYLRAMKWGLILANLPYGGYREEATEEWGADAPKIVPWLFAAREEER